MPMGGYSPPASAVYATGDLYYVQNVSEEHLNFLGATVVTTLITVN